MKVNQSKPSFQETKVPIALDRLVKIIATNYPEIIMNPPIPPIPTEESISIPELQEKFAQLQADPEFRQKPFWQRIVEIGSLVPQSEWRKQLPTDFARNFEHYMYGAPKEEE